jgi:hypothetical protein
LVGIQLVTQTGEGFQIYIIKPHVIMFKRNQAEEKCKKKPVGTLLSEYETRMGDGTVYRSIRAKLGEKLGWHVLYWEFGT